MIDYTTTRTDRAYDQGLYVSAVSHTDNFEVGDRIVAVNDSEVTTCRAMREVIGAFTAGDTVHVTVLRDAAPVDVPVVLTETDVPPGGDDLPAA